MGDKVKYSIKNVHYAVINEETTATAWDKPVPIPGAVSLSLEPEGDVTPFYADGMLYFQSSANNGYSGDLEVAVFPVSFLKDVFLYEECETSKVLIENSTKQPKPFALLFEEEGDVEGTKFVAYKCTATRPSRSLETATESKEPTTQTISLTMAPLADGRVIAMTQETTTPEVKKSWYTKVFEETKSEPAAPVKA